jgi:hypothetical protein
MKAPGARSLILVAGDRLRLMVDETFVEPHPGWAEGLHAEIVVSCVPSRLLKIAEDVVSSDAVTDPTAFSSVGYNPFRDIVEAGTTRDVARLRRTIEERYGAPVPENLVEIGRFISGGPAVATSSAPPN